MDWVDDKLIVEIILKSDNSKQCRIRIKGDLEHALRAVIGWGWAWQRRYMKVAW